MSPSSSSFRAEAMWSVASCHRPAERRTSTSSSAWEGSNWIKRRYMLMLVSAGQDGSVASRR